MTTDIPRDIVCFESDLQNANMVFARCLFDSPKNITRIWLYLCMKTEARAGRTQECLAANCGHGYSLFSASFQPVFRTNSTEVPIH
jgi:hypothetical protein